MNLYKVGKVILATVYIILISGIVFSLLDGFQVANIPFYIVSIVIFVTSTLLVKHYGKLIVKMKFNGDNVIFTAYNKSEYTENRFDCEKAILWNGSFVLHFSNGKKYRCFTPPFLYNSDINIKDFNKDNFPNAY